MYFKDRFNCLWKKEDEIWYQWVKPGHVVFPDGWNTSLLSPPDWFKIKELSDEEAFLELL